MTPLHLELLSMFVIPRAVYTLFNLTLYTALVDLALNGLFEEDDGGAYVVTPQGYDA